MGWKDKIKIEELVKDTQTLIQIPSVLTKFNPEDTNEPFGSEIKRALKFMLEMAKKDDFKVGNIDNYAGYIEYGTGDKMIGVLCHLDVVPAGDNWSLPPFSAIIKDNRLYGRGAIDDKSAVMAVYYALKILKENNYELGCRVRLILGCDEESGMRCLDRYLQHEEEPQIGFSPDADFPLIYAEKGHAYITLVVHDPDIKWIEAGTRRNVVPDIAKMQINNTLPYNQFLQDNGYRGVTESNVIIANGISAHAMHPQKGVNAAYILLEYLASINNRLGIFCKEYLTFDHFGYKLGIECFDKEMQELTFNLGTIKMVDEKIDLCIDVRFPKKEAFDTFFNKLSSVAQLAGYECRIDEISAVKYVSPNDMLVKTLMDVYQKHTCDMVSKPMVIGGGTYSKVIKRCVAFGPLFPNRPDIAHQPDEYIDIDDLVSITEIYTDAIIELGKLLKYEN